MDEKCVDLGVRRMSNDQEVSGFLEDYWNRNQVFRTLQFGSTLVSGLFEHTYPDAAGSLLRVANSISSMRVMLRLLDDIPVLAHTIRNWKPEKVSLLEGNRLARIIKAVPLLRERGRGGAQPVCKYKARHSNCFLIIMSRSSHQWSHDQR